MNYTVICFLIGLYIFLSFSTESFLDEENLEAEYAPAITKGGIVAGTVFDSRPYNEQTGMGWIL